MLKALILVSALVAAAASSPSLTSAKLTPRGVFLPGDGITDCGSAGRLGSVTVPDCDEIPCTFVPGTAKTLEIRFTASLTSSKLSLHIYKVEGVVLLLEVPIPGEIEAGVEYDLTFQLAITQEFSGQSFDIRFYILDEETRINEVCAEAPVKIA